jgi:glycosyltransferase involved in cell wall biosynthesis
MAVTAETLHAPPAAALREVPCLALVVPCYDEAEGLDAVIAEVQQRLGDWIRRGVIRSSSFACFVDDGSTDGTWEVIARHAAGGGAVRGIKLSRNFGHQAAVLAGLLRAGRAADCAVSIDADLQQDIGAVERFVEGYRRGAEVVLGVRRDRGTDGLAKRWTGEAFYWLMRRAGARIVRNHADFRLVSRKVIEALDQYQESNLFLRGLIHELGFRTAEVVFDVHERRTGRSKYGWPRMLGLALSGITSFSAFPLRVVAVLGFAITVLSFFMAGYVLFAKLFSGAAVPGWASTVLPLYLLGGVQMLSLGVVGEYVGRVYLETKRRPRFLVEDETA